MGEVVLDASGRPLSRVPRIVSGTVDGIAVAGVTTLTTLLSALYQAGWLRQVHINGAYVAGPNGSFKAQAGGGAKLTLVINMREVGGGAFRQLSNGLGDLELRTNDAQDLLTAPRFPISFSEDLQIQIRLNKNPSNPFDIQWWAEVDEFPQVVRG